MADVGSAGAPGEQLQLVAYPDDGTYEVPAPVDQKHLDYVNTRLKCVRLVELTVPDDKLFVLGDNSTMSYDSRQFGFVDRDWLIGKMVSPVR